MKTEEIFEGRRACAPCRRYAAEYAKKQTAKDPEKHRARRRQYMQDHPEQRLAAQKRDAAWRKKNPDSSTERSKAWRKNNPEKATAGRLAWEKKTGKTRMRDFDLESKTRVRARRHGASGHHTAKEWHTLVEISGWKCAYCKTGLTERTACRDHVVPLRRGGSNDISNIAPSCRACNTSKGNRTPKEFLKYLVEKSKR